MVKNISDSVNATADAVHPIRVRILNRTQSAAKVGSFLSWARGSVNMNIKYFIYTLETLLTCFRIQITIKVCIEKDTYFLHCAK